MFGQSLSDLTFVLRVLLYAKCVWKQGIGSRSMFLQSYPFCMLFKMWTDDVDAFLVHVDVALFGCLHIGVGALL